MTNENIPCNFHVGQKVVCIDDKNTNLYGLPEIVEGHVYEVRWTDGHSVRLAGIVRDDPEYMKKYCLRPGAPDKPFGANRFRPVVTRKADISVFKAMLKPSKTRVPA